MRGLLAVAVVVTVALVGAPQAVPQQLAKQLVVDKDGVQCPKAGFTSIQAAVNAASPGDTIKVCPDLYNESVSLTKPSLTLVGATNVNEAKCSTVTAADPTMDTIVTGGAFSLSLLNNDISVSGFVVQGAVDGIDTSAAFSGYRITSNIVQSNTNWGVNFLSSGRSQSRVDHNCIRMNSGDGVASELGNLSNGLVDHNVTYRNGGGGVDLSGAGARAYVTVTANVGSANTFGYLMDNSIGSSIDHNTSMGDTYGIYIGGANNGLAIVANDVEDAGINGIIFELSTFIPVFAAANVGLDVSGNTVLRSGSSGIVADAGNPNLTFSTVSNNTSSGNGLAAPRSGIRLQTGNNNNTVTNNTADKNSANGIHADGAVGNTFANNHMSLNVAFDARDENRPANTWTSNHCLTDFPAGTICTG
jgi:parallel beta-helix repeat protein